MVFSNIKERTLFLHLLCQMIEILCNLSINIILTTNITDFCSHIPHNKGKIITSE